MYPTRCQSSITTLLVCVLLLLQGCRSQMGIVRQEEGTAGIPRKVEEQQENASYVLTAALSSRGGALMRPTTSGTSGIPERPYDLFISYATEDKETIVEPLCEKLRCYGIRLLLYPARLRAGEHTPFSMQAAMERASCGIFILSPEFVAKQWSMQELYCYLKRREATEQKHCRLPHLLPIFYRLSYEECNNPTVFSYRYNNIFEQDDLSAYIHKGRTDYEEIENTLQKLSRYAGVEAGINTSPSQLMQSITERLGDKTERLRVLHRPADLVFKLRSIYLSVDFTLARSLFPDESPKHVKNLPCTLHLMPKHQDDEVKEQQHREPISVEELFADRSLQPGGSPCNIQRVLITGSPGIGKTTLSRYLAYRWAMGTWGQEFEVVYTLSVRNLQACHYDNTNFRRMASLSTAITNNCLTPPLPEYAYKALRQEVASHLHKPSTLIVLDGLDERSGASESIIHQATTGGHKLLLLSRSYQGMERERAIADIEVKHIGLSVTQVRSYINRVSSLPSEKSAELLSVLKQGRLAPAVWQVPINLQILCFLWHDPLAQANVRKAAYQGSLPSLYGTLTYAIWKRYITNARTVHRTLKDCPRVFDALGAISLQSIERGEILIDPEMVSKVMASYLIKDPDNLSNRGVDFLLLQWLASSNQYQFLHLTFQEYFGGRFLARQLFSHSEHMRTEASMFLMQNKYDPSYGRMFSFMSGEVSRRRGCLGLQYLLSLTGVSVPDMDSLLHLNLQMRLLNEWLCVNGEAEISSSLPLLEGRFKIFAGLQRQLTKGIHLVQDHEENTLLPLLVEMLEEFRSVAKYAVPLCLPCLLAACDSGSKDDYTSRICQDTLVLLGALSTTRCFAILTAIIRATEALAGMRAVAISALGSLVYTDATLSSHIITFLQAACASSVPAVRQAAHTTLRSLPTAPSEFPSTMLSFLGTVDSSIGFGKEAWSEYFGDVGEEPPLPSDIEEMLDSNCSFYPGRKVRDTHLLVLIPATVDGDRFTLNKLGTLIKEHFPANTEGYHRYNTAIKQELGSSSSDSSYWILLTRDVLLNSRGRGYPAQKTLVSNHVIRTGLPYRIPGILEASTAISLYYVRTNERLLQDDPATHIRCQEALSTGYQPIVGNFGPAGFDIYIDYNCGRHSDSGVACCWQL